MLALARAASSLLVAASLIGSTTAAPASSIDAHDLAKRCPPGFVQTNGTQFSLDDKPFFFAGTNSYWITHLEAESDVRLTLQTMKDAGIKVLRIWGFGIVDAVPENKKLAYYQFFKNGTVEYNWEENGIPRLDRIVRLAGEYEIKLVPALVNNWIGYGGMDLYNQQFASNNETAYLHDSFYTQPQIIQVYQDWVSLVVNRYKDSPSIFAWELANEARCSGEMPASPNCTVETLSTWMRDQSAFIKQLDPWHMVTSGDEGMQNYANSSVITDYVYNGGSGTSFDEILEMENIDYGTFHSYPGSWYPGKHDDGHALWGTNWIREHIYSSYVAKKPVVLEEFGLDTYENATLIYPLWYDAALKGDIGGIMNWQWGQSGLSQEGNIKYNDDIVKGFSPDDGYATYSNDTTTYGYLVNAAKIQNAKSG